MHFICQSSQFIVAYDNHCLCVYKKVSHLPLQLGIFVFTFTVKRFHIYGALLHLALKVFTFTVPYYIFTFWGATGALVCCSEGEKTNKRSGVGSSIYYSEILKTDLKGPSVLF